MTHPYWLPLGIVLLTAPMSSTALESAVAGSLKQEASWTALKNQITSTQAKLELQRALLEQVVLCNNKKRFYAPGAGADGQGCAAADVATVPTPPPPPPPPPAYTPSPPPPPAAPSCSSLMGQSCTLTSTWVGNGTGCGGSNCQIGLPAGWTGTEVHCTVLGNTGVTEVGCRASGPGTYDCSGQCK